MGTQSVWHILVAILLLGAIGLAAWYLAVIFDWIVRWVNWPVALVVGSLALLLSGVVKSTDYGPYFGAGDNVILMQEGKLRPGWDEVAIFYGYSDDFDACKNFATEYVKKFFAMKLMCISKDRRLASGVIEAPTGWSTMVSPSDERKGEWTEVQANCSQHKTDAAFLACADAVLKR